MWWRLAFPLMMLLGPRLIPWAVRNLYLVWKLLTDGRVPWLAKLVLPAPLLYLVTPMVRIPFVGVVGFVVLVLLAMRIFVALAPRHVVDFHAPWRSRGEPPKPPKEPANVVEGTYRVVDEDDAEK
jgi:hypothetical protein